MAAKEGMVMSEPRTVHFPPIKAMERPGKPDICILRNIGASLREALETCKLLGVDERGYVTDLRVIATQAELAATLAKELLSRTERKEE
jgi:hypothetical protein